MAAALPSDYKMQIWYDTKRSHASVYDKLFFFRTQSTATWFCKQKCEQQYLIRCRAVTQCIRCRCHALTQCTTQQDKQQWTAISATLYNTYRYYSQFVGLMQKAISGGLAELEKQLEVTDLPVMLWTAAAVAPAFSIAAAVAPAFAAAGNA